jgi:transcriptional regulator with XRE-family HTH domain
MLLDYPSVMLRGWRKRLADTVQAIKASDGPDMKALSKKAKLSGSYVHAILKQGRTPSIDNFLKIAQACDVEPCWLLFGDDRCRTQFPVVGRAQQAEVWQPVDADNVEKVSLEPGGAAVDMVVIAVVGDSHAPAYRDGDLLFCSRRAGSNLQKAIIGHDCVMRTRAGECLIKQVLKGQKLGTFTLRSVSNPIAKDLRNVLLDWAAPIVWIRRGRGRAPAQG